MCATQFDIFRFKYRLIKLNCEKPKKNKSLNYVEI